MAWYVTYMSSHAKRPIIDPHKLNGDGDLGEANSEITNPHSLQAIYMISENAGLFSVNLIP